MQTMPWPGAYPWHNEHTSHHHHVVSPGAVLRRASLAKADSFTPAPVAPSYHEVHPHEFETAISKHPNQASLDSPRDYTNKRTFLAADGSSGYALKPDGELNHVFSLKPGHGAHAVQHALQNGARHLSAFDGKLPQYYSQFGFKEYRREKNWTPGQPDVVFMQMQKAEPEHPTNDQVAGVGVSTYSKYALPYGSIDKSGPSNLIHYPYQSKAHEINQLVNDHGYTVYYAGGKYGRPDLAARNYDTKHLMVYDPSPNAGGNSGVEAHTDAWRKIHELAHALTRPELNGIYGEARRIGKLGHHRTMNEALRAVHWEWLAAHKQRELSKQIGIDIPDPIFNKELNTVMHDAVHRAVTGKFTEPSQEGFRPHDHHVPLEHALGLVREAAHNLGLTGMHDLIQKNETDIAEDSIEPRELRLMLAKSLRQRVDAYSQEMLALRQRELKKNADSSAAPLAHEPAPEMNPMDKCPMCQMPDLPGQCKCLQGPLAPMAKSDSDNYEAPDRPYPEQVSPRLRAREGKQWAERHERDRREAAAQDAAVDSYLKNEGRDVKKTELCKNCGKSHEMKKCGLDEIRPGPSTKKAELSDKPKEPVKTQEGSGGKITPLKALRKAAMSGSTPGAAPRPGGGNPMKMPTPKAGSPSVGASKPATPAAPVAKTELAKAGMSGMSKMPKEAQAAAAFDASKAAAKAPASAPAKAAPMPTQAQHADRAASFAAFTPPPTPGPGTKLPPAGVTHLSMPPASAATPKVGPKPTSAGPVMNAARPQASKPGIFGRLLGKAEKNTETSLKKALGACALCGKDEHLGPCR